MIQTILPQARWVGMLEAPRSGYIAAIHAEQVGMASVRLGAGRARKGDPIDPAVGFVLQAKVGDHVEKGQPLIEVHARTASAGKACVLRCSPRIPGATSRFPRLPSCSALSPGEGAAGIEEEEG